MTKKEMSEIVPRSAPTTNSNLRAVKMGQPICYPCQELRRARWWETCEHDPYFTVEYQPVSVGPEMERDEETGTMTLSEGPQKMKEVRRPNLTQVGLHTKYNSGRAPEIFRREKGFLTTEEMDLPSMCEYFDCWELDPKYRTDWGNYCNPGQARHANIDQNDTVLESFHTPKRNEQLQRIPVVATA